jgi:prophage maintenance system killer protein
VGLNTIEYNERTAKRKTKCSGLIKPFKKHCHFNIQPSRLRPDQVRSSIARRLGIEIAGEVSSTAIAHLWFVTIHPFDDGNGRIARAIADMQLARADASRQRFYSMSAQIQSERNVYYGRKEIWILRNGCCGLSNALTEPFHCLKKIYQG